MLPCRTYSARPPCTLLSHILCPPGLHTLFAAVMSSKHNSPKLLRFARDMLVLSSIHMHRISTFKATFTALPSTYFRRHQESIMHTCWEAVIKVGL